MADNKEPTFLDLLLETHVGLDRQGPGSPATVERALSFLGDLSRFGQVADLGCGPGGQRILLAERLRRSRITGLDLFPAFADALNAKAARLGLADRVTGVAGDMVDPPFEKGSLDLIWSEGAIDNIGFENGLRLWRPLLKTGGCVAVTCPSRLTKECPEEVERFWADAGSRLDAIGDNVAAMLDCGYAFTAAFTLTRDCWTERYFRPREQAIRALEKLYPDSQTMRDYAALNRLEVELYEKYGRHYGYVFYIGEAV